MRKTLMCAFIVCNLIVLLWVAMTAGGTDTEPRMLSTLDNPKPTLEAFFDCLSEERFDECGEYISNYSTFGADLEASLESVGSSADIAAYLYENLIASYDMQFIDPDDMRGISGDVQGADYSVNGTDAAVTFRMTVFDTGKFSSRLSEIVKKVAQRHKNKGEEIDTDEKAYALVGEAFEQIKQEPAEDFLSTALVTVNMVYVDGAWRIEMDNDFANALLGDITAYGGAVSDSDVASGSDSEGGAM